MSAVALDLLGEGGADDVVFTGPDGSGMTYAGLRADVDGWCRLLETPAKAVVVCVVERTPSSIAAYLAALRLGQCVVLVERGRPMVEDLVERLRPELCVTNVDEPAFAGYTEGRSRDGLVVRSRREAADPPPDDACALVLRTSGSIGEPKLVRLSYDNVASNAAAVAETLELSAASRGVTSLPIDFSFGLSVLHSHLVRGAGLLVTDLAPTSRRFWFGLARARCSDLGAVPFTLRALDAAGWRPQDAPSLRLLYQAGGPLAPRLVERFATSMAAVGGDFRPMYGQTEATARITCMPRGAALEHPATVGAVLPGGRLSIDAPDGGVGEIVYEGPNVMLGYALRRVDLGLGDVVGGRLRTGDLGRLQNGFLSIEGRRDREMKILGVRINLDRLTAALGGDVAVVADSDDRIVVAHTGVAERLAPLIDAVALESGLSRSVFRAVRVGSLPTSASGKVELARVREMISG